MIWFTKNLINTALTDFLVNDWLLNPIKLQYKLRPRMGKKTWLKMFLTDGWTRGCDRPVQQPASQAADTKVGVFQGWSTTTAFKLITFAPLVFRFTYEQDKRSFLSSLSFQYCCRCHNREGGWNDCRYTENGEKYFEGSWSSLSCLVAFSCQWW